MAIPKALQGIRLRLGTWNWICQYVASAGGGLFTSKPDDQSKGLIHDVDYLVEGIIEEDEHGVRWTVAEAGLPTQSSGCGSIQAGTVCFLTALYRLRAEVILRRMRPPTRPENLFGDAPVREYVRQEYQSPCVLREDW